MSVRNPEHGSLCPTWSRIQSGEAQKPQAFEEAIAAERLFLMLESQVVEITFQENKVAYRDAVKELPNDAVIVCAGANCRRHF